MVCVTRILMSEFDDLGRSRYKFPEFKTCLPSDFRFSEFRDFGSLGL